MMSIIAVMAFYALAVYALARVSRRAQRTGVGGSVIGPFEEIWHPAAHRARIQVQVQVERRMPGPMPGEPPFRGGVIRL